MIEGGDKKGKHVLPCIEEETHRSSDSMSTLEGDCLSLASLEADLFEDIRASIQKSSKVSDKESSVSKAGALLSDKTTLQCKSFAALPFETSKYLCFRDQGLNTIRGAAL